MTDRPTVQQSRRAIARVLARLSSVWLVLPGVVAVDVAVALSRGMPWRGELAWFAEAMTPAVLLLAPVLAGVGAWEARRDRDLDHEGTLRSCAAGSRHALGRILLTGAAAAVAHLLVLAGFGVTSIARAHIGPVPGGVVATQLLALVAFVAMGYLIGGAIDHVVGPVIAAVTALVAAYVDYLTPLPFGFLSDTSTGTLLGYQQSWLAVIGRAAWSVGLVALCWALAVRAFAVGRVARSATGCAVILLVAAVPLLLLRPQVWQLVPSSVVADHCAGTQPQICVPADFEAQLARTANFAARAERLLGSTGAAPLPARYVGWWPGAAADLPVVTVSRPGTAAEPVTASVVAADLVAPSSCGQWRSGADLDQALGARELVVTWLADQDSVFGAQPGDGSRPFASDAAGPQARAWLRLSPAEQRTWVASAASALAGCRFDQIPALPALPALPGLPALP